MHINTSPNALIDTVAWATGTHVGTGDHATELFCILYGCVLGLYFDILHNPLPPLDLATTLVECGRDGTQKHLSCASLQYGGSTDGVSKFADCSTEVEQVNGNALHCRCTLCDTPQ